MKRVSISFIIPYYKVPLPQLVQCIESVRALGDHADWEIRLVNDGTPGDEAERYLQTLNDIRIHYLRQDNRGLGAARNTGWEACRKEYIHFLDADDYLFVPIALQALNLLADEHPDLLAFDGLKVRDEAKAPCPATRIPVKFRGSGTDYMLRHNLHGAAWGYFFRKEAAGDLRFTPGIYHEDEEFTPLLWLRMQRIVVTTLPVYAYRQRPDSIMNDRSRDRLQKRFDDLAGILDRLQAGTQQLPADAARALHRRTDMVALAMLYTLMRESPDAAFLHGVLERMRSARFYPQPAAGWSVLYTAFRLCTCRPWLVAVFSRVLHSLNH